ncbi:MAG: glycosyltransferase family 39 protein [Methanoregula sp.]
MAKKKGIRESEKTPGPVKDCDLDGGYSSPLQTLRDFSVDNIKAVLVQSRYLQALIVLTILGLFFRFYNLGFNSLWLDEASTYSISQNSLWGIWQITAGGEFNPPLFYWAEHLMLAFGNSEFVLRFLPAFLGVLIIPLFYLVGKEFFDRNVGIIAAAACAFSPFLIYYSQEARAYMMMLFFVALATLFFLKALKSGTILNWALFGVFSALAFWSHFYAFVIIASLVLYALILWVPRIRTELNNVKMLVAGIAVFVLLCLPLIIVTVQLFITRTSSAPTYGIQGVDIIIQTFSQISGFNTISMIVLLVLFVIGIIQAYLIDRSKAFFLILLAVLTFVISFILSFRMPMQPRYLIFLSLVLFIGAAISYRSLYSLWNNRAVVYVLMAIMVLISVPVLTNYYSGYSKEDWRGFSGFLTETVSPGDMIITVPGYIAQPLDYYYSSNATGTLQYQATTAEDLQKIFAEKGNSTLYFVVTGDISAADPSGGALGWLENNTRYAGAASNGGIYLFTNP